MPLQAVFSGYDAAVRAGHPAPIAGGVAVAVELASGRRVSCAITLHAGRVVRVRLGDPAVAAPVPVLDLPPEVAAVRKDRPDRVSVSGGGMTGSVDLDAFGIVIGREDGTVLWRSSLEDVDQKGRHRVLAFGVEGDPIDRATAAFEVDPSEHFLGLGEKFCRLDKFGLTIDCANSNAGGATSELAYKNVPFFISTRGFGVLFNTTTHIRHDVANPTLSILSYVATVESPVLDFLLIDGPTPRDILRTYADLTGHAPVPPLWSFGLWVSRFYYETWRSLDEAVDGFRERGIPADVVNTDTYWMRGDCLSDMQWDLERFPDPPAHIESLRRRGFRLCLWEYPYLSRRSPLWQEAWDNRYLVARSDGSPCDVQTTLPVPTHHLEGFRGVGSLMHVYKQPLVEPGTLIDFTNPAAVAWWKELHRSRLKEGVAVFKTDFGEDVPPDARFHDGRTGREVHNLYPLLYQQAVAEVTEEETGERILWGRSGWIGGQRFPVHWGGDPVTTFAALAGTVRGALSYGLSGVPFWSHDIGGFAGPPPDAALYVRWAQFGLLSSHARTHGTTPREPWEFGAEAEDIFRRYARLRYRLLPYLYACAHEAAETGLPLMRAMVIEFPDDPTCAAMDGQYMLGPDLLIAPVTNAEGHVDVYLPGGRWADYWTGERFDGPRWLKRRHLPLAVMPVYVRAGAVLPQAPDMAHTEERPWDTLTFEVLPLADALRRFPTPDGGVVTVEMRLAGGVASLAVDGPERRYRASVIAPGTAAPRDDRTISLPDDAGGRASVDLPLG